MFVPSLFGSVSLELRFFFGNFLISEFPFLDFHGDFISFIACINSWFGLDFILSCYIQDVGGFSF